MTTTVTNPFQACVQVLIKPNGVFEALEDAKNWSWIPFILISIATIIPSYMYFGAVDFEWYRELIISTQAANLSPAEIETQRAFITLSSMRTASFVAPLGLILASAVIALYLNLATKGDEENVNGFTDWFGFAWWISLPVVINSIIAVLLLSLSSDPQINPAILAPTSLAFILGLPLEHDWFGLLQNVSLISVWSIYLTAVGVNRWTDLGSKKSNVIAILPYAVIAGIWTIVNLV
ncbi:YIP1 family protein [Alteromonadaceae bacterium M269]|nr:YIP1 family protein [Alteromonadaceae bacterium M269]